MRQSNKKGAEYKKIHNFYGIFKIKYFTQAEIE